MIELIQGSIFDSKCDMIIIPCNSSGGITNFVFRELSANELPYYSQSMLAGEVAFIEDVGSFSNASAIGYAASVDVSSRSSREEYIKQISEKIKKYCEYHSFQKVNIPLLGTGAGQLTARQSFNAMKSIFEDSTITVCVYVLNRRSYNELVDENKISIQRNRNIHIKNPRVFISYSVIDKDNQNWVKNLACKLRESGVDARLDIFHLKPGQEMAQWMTNEVLMADKVLLICDKYYAEKADLNKGGVGWENMIIQADMLSNQDKTKYIAIQREPDANQAIPIYMKSKFSMKWTDEAEFDDKFHDLLLYLFNCDIAPPLRKEPPDFIKEKLLNNS